MVATESVSESSIISMGDGGRLVLGVLVPPGPPAGPPRGADFSGTACEGAAHEDAACKGAATSVVESMANSYTEVAMLGRNLGSEKILGTWEDQHCKKSSS